MIIIKRLALIFVLIFFSSSVYAEYYIVYSTPPCGYSCATSVHKIHKKKHHHKIHKVHKVVKHTYKRVPSPAIYYVWKPVPICTCGGCASDAVAFCCNQSEMVRVKVKEVYYGKPVYINTEDDYYDPDLATGDDDAMFDPNLDIDR